MTDAAAPRADPSAAAGLGETPWPDGKRLAVFVMLDLTGGPGVRQDISLPRSGDSTPVLTEARRLYGLHTGVLAMLDEFRASETPVTCILNGDTIEEAPSAITAFVNRADELIPDGRGTDIPEPTLLAGLIETLCGPAGKPSLAPPRGCFGPLIHGRHDDRNRFEQLAALRYDYCFGLNAGDCPRWIGADADRIPMLPYPQELNDHVQIVQRSIEAPYFADMVMTTLEEHLRRPRVRAAVFGLALHPGIMGQAHRAPQLRRILNRLDTLREKLWLCHARDIAKAVLAETGPVPTGAMPHDRMSCSVGPE